MVRIAQIEKTNINALGLLAASAQQEVNFGWGWCDWQIPARSPM